MGVEPSRCCHHTDLNRARLPIPPLLHLREMGLEPTRAYTHKILSLACLPIPALPHFVISSPTKISIAYYFRKCNYFFPFFEFFLYFILLQFPGQGKRDEHTLTGRPGAGCPGGPVP